MIFLIDPLATSGFPIVWWGNGASRT